MYEFCEQFAKDLANLSNEQVLIRRKQIHSLMMERIKEGGRTLTPHNISQVFTERLIDYLLNLYDQHFFESSLMSTFRANKCCLSSLWKISALELGGKWRRR